MQAPDRPSTTTLAQKSALSLICSSCLEGVRADGHALLSSGKWHKFDVRTLLALCTRGLLEGRAGALRPTDAGFEMVAPPNPLRPTEKVR